MVTLRVQLPILEEAKIEVLRAAIENLVKNTLSEKGYSLTDVEVKVLPLGQDILEQSNRSLYS
ncbi:MAG: hypothetical protein WCF93_02865 [Candidatus Moraniibacteriota bacterium]